MKAELEQSSVAQAKYLDSVAREHRDRFGQFFTPSSLAEFMASWVVSGGASSVFDPAVGMGAFQAAVLKAEPHVKLSGCEKDSAIATAFRRCDTANRVQLFEADYLESSFGPHESVICNPPYLRFQNFEGRTGHLERLSRSLGVRLSGYTNAASAFLLKALFELKVGGRLAFVMPLEFLGTGYGREVKKVLLGSCSRLQLIQVSDEEGIFPEVITSVGLVLLEKGAGLSAVKFSRITSAKELDGGPDSISAIEVPVASGMECQKWTRYFLRQDRAVFDGFVPLSEYGRFSRGIATGANEFFVASRSRVDSLGLPSSVAVPCITRSSQIATTVFTEAHLNDLIRKDEPVFLLDLERDLGSPAVQKYVMEGERAGLQERYLLKSRSPWFRIEKRRAPSLFFGVFSRGGYKVIRNDAAVASLTPFHGFIPNLLGLSHVEHLWLFLSSDAGRRAIELQKRVYGAQLDKLEPNDLNQVLVPSAQMFHEIGVEFIQSGAESLARSGLVGKALEDAFEGLLGRDVCTSDALGLAPMAFLA